MVPALPREGTMTNRFLSCIALAAIMLTAAPAHAQLNGENLLGDMGVKSGSQPEPGFYVGNIFYRYRTETIRNGHGDRIVFDPQQSGSQTINVFAPIVVYISRAKILGANYGMMAVVPLAKGALEAPALGVFEEASKGLADTYVVPFQLGWHSSRTDITTAFGFFAPTGRYEADATDNLGKGRWSYELSAGSTVYVDKGRSVSLSTTAYWESHTRKKDTRFQIGAFTTNGVRVGQLMTLEGGAAKSWLGGALSVGMAYYGQWKLSSDDLGIPVALPNDPELGRHRVFAFGPDVTIPIGTRDKLISLVNVRYLWETVARIKTEGPTFTVTTTVPIPSIKISSR
jgi:hypothetical protein